MDRLTIGEVCELLDVKPHVVRYWEQEIDLLSPEKDLSGRRSYSAYDLQILARIKHLVQERKFTVEGARERLFAELTGPGAGANAGRKALLQEIRQTLFRAARTNQTLNELISSASDLPGVLVDRNGTSPGGSFAPGDATPLSQPAPEYRVLRIPQDIIHGSTTNETVAVCAVSIVPEAVSGKATLAGMEAMLLEQARALSAIDAGSLPALLMPRLWLVVVPGGTRPHAEHLLSESAAAPVESIVLENERVSAGGRGSTRTDSGWSGLFHAVRGKRLYEILDKRGISVVCGRDAPERPGRSLIPVPATDVRLWYAHTRWNVDLALAASRSDGRSYTLTGEWLCTVSALRALKLPPPYGLYDSPALADSETRHNLPSLRVQWLGLMSMIRRSVIVEGGENERT